MALLECFSGSFFCFLFGNFLNTSWKAIPDNSSCMGLNRPEGCTLRPGPLQRSVLVYVWDRVLKPQLAVAHTAKKRKNVGSCL